MAPDAPPPHRGHRLQFRQGGHAPQLVRQSLDRRHYLFSAHRLFFVENMFVDRSRPGCAVPNFLPRGPISKKLMERRRPRLRVFRVAEALPPMMDRQWGLTLVLAKYQVPNTKNQALPAASG